MPSAPVPSADTPRTPIEFAEVLQVPSSAVSGLGVGTDPAPAKACSADFDPVVRTTAAGTVVLADVTSSALPEVLLPRTAVPVVASPSSPMPLAVWPNVPRPVSLLPQTPVPCPVLP